MRDSDVQREINHMSRKYDDDDIQDYVRPWVNLTDEEMRECNMDGDIMINRETAKLNVQAKLKEKNHG